MHAAVKETKASVALECIAGDSVGEMCDYLGFNSTVIVYGLLSEKPIGNINPLLLIGRCQKIEGFMLPNYMATLKPEKAMDFAVQAEQQCQSTFKTEINKRFGLHQIDQALAFYKENQTAGKVILRPDLTE